MSNGIPVDLETFQKLETPEAKMDALFKVTESTHKKVATLEDGLKRHHRVDAGIAGVTGIVGGVLAVAGKWLFFRGPQ